VIARGQTGFIQCTGHVARAWLGIIYFLKRSHLNVAVTGPGQVTNHAEQRKIDKYAALSKEFQFIPIAIETLGPVRDEATRFLQELGRRIESVTRDSQSMSFLWQQLSVAVQKGNAAQNIGRERTLWAVFNILLSIN